MASRRRRSNDLVRTGSQAEGQEAFERGLDELRTDPDAEDRPDEGRLEPFWPSKPEHAVDLDTGVVVAALIHLAEAGDTATLGPHTGRGAEEPRRRGSYADV